MKLQTGARYVLNNGLKTSELIDCGSGRVFVGSVPGEPGRSYWYYDGTYCGFDRAFPMSISHPVTQRFLRRRSQL